MTRLLPLLLLAGLLVPSSSIGESVAVRQAEGLIRGFLSLRSLDGKLLANGDLLQVARGGRVTTRLVFHFRDGSLHEERAVYTQRQRFRLLSDHLVQKGPSFPQPIDMSIDAVSGKVTVKYTDDHGAEKVESEQMELPDDLANGLVLTLLKNVGAATAPIKVGFVAATPKPRLVTLEISPSGQEPFSTGGVGRKATHYVVKVHIGGIAGVVAPIVGKQPADSHVWIL